MIVTYNNFKWVKVMCCSEKNSNQKNSLTTAQQQKKNAKSVPFFKYRLGLVLRHTFFFDTGTFAATLTKEIQFGTANFTYFVQDDAFNIGAV